MWHVVEIAGMTALGILAAALAAVGLALAVAFAADRGRTVPLKRVSVFILDFLYLPLKMLFAAFKSVPKLDQVMVSLKNQTHRPRFAAADRRVVLAPQCLRALECPARSSRRGILCVKCGKCKVGGLAAEAERLGYGFYLLTGSSFVRTIIEEDKPDAALLVACAYECNKVMMALGRLPTYGVSLDSDGCVGTEVTESNVLAAMRIGRESDTSADPAAEAQD